MEKAAFAPGLIDEEAEDCELLAGRCSSCGKLFFPKRAFCLECQDEELETVRISGAGTLYTYTIVNMPSANYAAPYAIGWVEFPEGLRVFGQIRGWDAERLRIGMKMRMVAGVLWKEKDREVVGYIFEPDTEPRPAGKRE
jgi:uncharacterized OB-fold protein